MSRVLSKTRRRFPTETSSIWLSTVRRRPSLVWWKSSPLQVHVWAGLYAHTRVSLTGALDTTWPEALVLTTPGDPEGGHLSFHYGLDTGAEAKVNISVASLLLP